jgi:transcription initiation factor IIE alpha subunit
METSCGGVLKLYARSMKIEELKKVIEILKEEYPKLKAPIEKLIGGLPEAL